MNREDKIKVLAELDGWEHLPEGHFHPDNPIGQTPPSYLTSYDAIIPLIHKQSLAVRQKMCHDQIQFPFTFTQSIMATPEQLADALIKAVGKWKE